MLFVHVFYVVAYTVVIWTTMHKVAFLYYCLIFKDSFCKGGTKRAFQVIRQLLVYCNGFWLVNRCVPSLICVGM